MPKILTSPTKNAREVVNPDYYHVSSAVSIVSSLFFINFIVT